ncbi:MAG: hypothetical protein AAB606_01755, partial [Patescibacteria group bacterium]
MDQTAQPKKVIKSIYFYLVSFVALMMVVWSTADMINIALKTLVFKAADKDMYYNPPCALPAEAAARPDVKSIPAVSVADCEKQNEANLKQQEESRFAQRQRDV